MIPVSISAAGAPSTANSTIAVNFYLHGLTRPSVILYFNRIHTYFLAVDDVADASLVKRGPFKPGVGAVISPNVAGDMDGKCAFLEGFLDLLGVRLGDLRLSATKLGGEVEDRAFDGGDVRVGRAPGELVALDVAFDDFGDNIFFQGAAHGDCVVEGLKVGPLELSGCCERNCAEEGGEETRDFHCEMSRFGAVMFEVAGEPAVLDGMAGTRKVFKFRL